MVFIFVEFEFAEVGTIMVNLPAILYIKENNIADSCAIGTPAGELLVKHSKKQVIERIQSAMRTANSSSRIVLPPNAN